MLLQPDKSYFIISMIKEVEAHEVRSHWTLIKYFEVKNKHKNKYGKLKTILFICYFNRKGFSDEILMKHRSRLYAHGVIQKWGVNYW